MVNFLKMLVGTSLAFLAKNALASSNDYFSNDESRSIPAQVEMDGSEETNAEITSREALTQEELSQEMKEFLQAKMQTIVNNDSCVVEVLRPDVSSAVIKGGY